MTEYRIGRVVSEMKSRVKERRTLSRGVGELKSEKLGLWKRLPAPWLPLAGAATWSVMKAERPADSMPTSSEMQKVDMPPRAWCGLGLGGREA